MLADLRAAWRALRAAPGHTLAAVCCLALGLGANAAVFQVADAIFFRPPPGVRDPGRLVRVVAERRPAGPPGSAPPGFFLRGVTPAELDRTAGVRQAVRSAAGYDGGRLTVGRGADAREAVVQYVTPGFFQTLGVAAARGRTFAPGEERAHAPPVAVVSHRYWADAMGGDPRAVGRTLLAGGTPVVVVGVAAPRFNGPDLTPRVDLWVPTAQAAALRGQPEDDGPELFPSLQVVARLAEGVPPAAVAPRLQAALARPDPAVAMGPMRFTAPAVRVAPLRAGDFERETAAGSLARWLAAVSALVLVVACANVAGLALARGVARRRELAVRLALGAGRARLVRQLAAEGALVTAGGAAAAVVVWAAAGALLRRFPALPEPPAPDWRFAAAGLAVAGAVAVACGLLPALASTRAGLRAALHEAGGAAAGASAGRAHAREALLVGQLAVTLVLVAGAGLFLTSLANALRTDLGVDAEHMVFFEAGARRSLGEVLTPDAAARLRERAASLPGVRGAAFGAPAPFTGFGYTEVDVPGAPPAGRGERPPSSVNVDEHYLRTVGLRLVRGRDFTAADRPAQGAEPRVVLVSELMARRYWPGRDPVGRCVRFRADPMNPDAGFGGCLTVVGVVADARTVAFDRPAEATVYAPLAAQPGGFSSLVVRLDRPADARTAEAVRAALAAAVPDAPPLKAHPMREILDPQFAPHRLGAALFTLYGALALLLAAVGLYGVVRYNAERRSRELAVRSALGARPADLARLVTGAGARLALLGAAAGVAGALAAARLIEGLLYGVRPADPRALAGAAAVLTLVALVASYLPARRAARADPAAALRSE